MSAGEAIPDLIRDQNHDVESLRRKKSKRRAKLAFSGGKTVAASLDAFIEPFFCLYFNGTAVISLDLSLDFARILRYIPLPYATCSA